MTRDEVLDIVSEAAESLHDRFPPPGKFVFDAYMRTVRAVIAEHDPAGIFSDALTVLPRTPYWKHYVALFHTSLSVLDSGQWPWSGTLSALEEKWPEWGVPWLLAARQTLMKNTVDLNELAVARKQLFAAARLLPVGDRSLLKNADRLRKHCDRLLAREDGRSRRKSRELPDIHFDSLQLLATHVPSVRNYSRFIEALWRADQQKRGREWIERFVEIQGVNPEHWHVREQYDDLSAAGALCQYMNMAAATRGGKHHFRYWNEAATVFFRKAIESPVEKGGGSDRVYALIRLCETYAQTLRHVDRGQSDEEYNALLERAVEAIQHLGWTCPGQRLTAQRHLTLVYAGAARRARSLGHSREKIDRWVQKADESYVSQIETAKPPMRPKLRKLRAEFLFEFGRYEEVLEAAAGGEEVEVVEAAALYRKGSRREAVKKLIAFMSSAERSQLIGYAGLLVHYLKEIEANARITTDLRQRAIDALKPVLGLLISEVTDALDDDDTIRARRRLEVVSFVEGGMTDRRLAHLNARVGLAEIEQGSRSAAGVLAELEEAFAEAPMLCQEPYLREIYLKILSRDSAIEADTDMVWQMASAPGLSGSSNNVLLYHALRWQIEGNRRKWWPCLLEVSRLFPENRAFLRLPMFLWERQGTAAIDAIMAVRQEPLTAADLRWLRDLIEGLPGEFFAQDKTIRVFCDWISSSDDLLPISSAFAHGLARAQVAATSDSELQWRLIRRAASAIDDLRRQSSELARWSDWLGGERHAIRRVAFQFAARTVETLNHTLVQSGERRRDVWVSTLAEFVGVAKGHLEERSAGPGKDLIDFCVRSTEAYDPASLDRNYYTGLSVLIDRVVEESEPADLSAEMARIWREMFLAVGVTILRRVVDPAVGPIHRFKNDLLNPQHPPEVTTVEVRQFEKMTRGVLRFLHSYSSPNVEEVNLNRALKAAVLRPPIAAPAGELRDRPAVYVVADAKFPYVEGDENLVVEALSALVENAYRSTSQAEHARWVWCEVRTEGSEAVVEITDSGCGADAKKLRILNDAQANLVASGVDGTGYGTRLGHRVASLFGGALSFASAGPRTGMTVRLRLPVMNRSRGC